MSDEGIEYLFPMTSICPPWSEAHEDERGKERHAETNRYGSGDSTRD